MDLSGVFSKLPRSVLVASSVHHQLRALDHVDRERERENAAQRVTPTEAELRDAEAQYPAGATLREVAAPLEISRMRLGFLLRRRGIRVRGGSPTHEEVDQTVRLYEQVTRSPVSVSDSATNRTRSEIGF